METTFQFRLSTVNLHSLVICFNTGQTGLLWGEVVGLTLMMLVFSGIKHLSWWADNPLYLASADNVVYLLFSLKKAVGQVLTRHLP